MVELIMSAAPSAKAYYPRADCLYCKYHQVHPLSIRQPLPQGKNLDGRPAWEPPILDYSTLIDEQHDKKREAVMKHFGGNRAKTTDFMDLDTEFAVLDMYGYWLVDNGSKVYEEGDLELRAWLDALTLEVRMDSSEVFDEYCAFDLYLEKGDDGEWAMKLGERHPDYRQIPESQFSEDGISSSSQHDNPDASDTQLPQSWELQNISIPVDQFQDNISPSHGPSLITTFMSKTPGDEVISFDAAAQPSPSDINTSPTSDKDTYSIEAVAETETDSAPFDLFNIWT